MSIKPIIEAIRAEGFVLTSYHVQQPLIDGHAWAQNKSFESCRATLQFRNGVNDEVEITTHETLDLDYLQGLVTL